MARIKRKRPAKDPLLFPAAGWFPYVVLQPRSTHGLA